MPVLKRGRPRPVVVGRIHSSVTVAVAVNINVDVIDVRVGGRVPDTDQPARRTDAALARARARRAVQQQPLVRRRQDHPVRPDARHLRHLLAIGAILDHQTDRLLDAHPMVLLRDRRRRLVDAAMLKHMHLSRNLILPLRIGHDLLVLEHEPLAALDARLDEARVVARHELVVRGGAAETAFLRPVRPVRVFAVLEVEADLVEALFGHEVFAFRT